jgi:hypothetical protein
LLSNFDVFLPIFHVQLLWELNPNMAKFLELKGYAKLERKKKGGGVRSKTSKEDPFVFSCFYFLFLLSLSPSLSFFWRRQKHVTVVARNAATTTQKLLGTLSS